MRTFFVARIGNQKKPPAFLFFKLCKQRVNKPCTKSHALMRFKDVNVHMRRSFDGKQTEHSKFSHCTECITGSGFKQRKDVILESISAIGFGVGSTQNIADNPLFFILGNKTDIIIKINIRIAVNAGQCFSLFFGLHPRRGSSGNTDMLTGFAVFLFVFSYDNSHYFTFLFIKNSKIQNARIFLLSAKIICAIMKGKGW